MLRLESFQFDETPTSTQQFEDSCQESQRIDPEEEYFRMSALSVKMQFTSVDPDFVFAISSKKLLKQCRKEGVEFHRMYDWLHAKCCELYQVEHPGDTTVCTRVEQNRRVRL